MASMPNEQSQVVVVVVPFPAHGHVNQLLHLSRQILACNIPVHCVATPIQTRQALLRLQAFWDPFSSPNFHLHYFHLSSSADSDSLRPRTTFPSHFNPSFEAFNSHHLREPVGTLLLSLSSVARRLVVIYDSLMASVVQDAAGLANAETYTFHSVSAFTMSLFFWEGKGKPSVENIFIPEVPSLEGCFATHFMDFICAQHKFHRFSNGNIYNTTRVIEGPYVKLIERINSSKKHWALGPFNPLVIQRKSSQDRHFSLNWLDKQDQNSVIYVSFGTTTTLTEEQIKQLAIGLEESEVRFILVLRNADKGDDFDAQVTRDEQYLKGFEERVKGIGLIVRDWAPQLEILSHPSTGGFMSHCGWNSCLESITMGVPIAAWPVHSDQPRNRVLITEVLQIGLTVRDWAHRDELVTASVVKNAVRRLMATREGDEMRKKAMNLKNIVLQSCDEGGVSRLEMEAFIAHITRV
ncbi:zeatin O-glucosyltransferase-like [Prosopis cineraria]|uniref:zeatin O-glucosyltransferase-like n=1 Tax=Prosopis cineraria TaxID=364024 RepID=UPI00240EE865|nr:zeatin O-glucosyltransferase-like [Prosopis cineraria]